MLLPEMFGKLLRLGEHVVAALAPGGGDRRHDIAEAGHAAAGTERPIGAAEERLLLRREEDRHRPATLAGHRLHGLHINMVEVGPLLAIDLDRDKIAIQQIGQALVLKTFMGHHVAPVAGRVSDGKEDRLLLRRGPRKRFRPPRLPRDWVVSMLE